jgi:branched-chain amino acid transport system substrate-binding protein
MWWRRAAAVVAVTLLAAACGGGAEEEPSEAASAPAAESEPMASEAPSAGASEMVEATGKGDGTLTIGTVLPESGQLAFLGAPMIYGVQQAIEDINAAGGFMDSDVVLETGDSGTDPTVARPTVNRLLGAGADAIVGAAASGVSQEIIQTLYDNEITQCSGSNTSPAFSEQDNAGFYFRTVPPDEAVTPVIVDTVIADGFSNVAVVARADDYGNALADLVEAGLQEANANVAVKTTYDPNTTGFDAQVQEVQNSNADAVVVIAFNEGAAFIRQLVEAGFDPAGLYGSDGIFAPSLPDDVGGGDDFIDGMTVIGASGSTEFNQDVLNPILPDDEKGNFIYGAQTYDCAIITALAANAAESDDAAVFAEEIVNVTTGGTECTSYEECLGMVQEGEDIDYNGAAGPIELEGNDLILGDPQVGRYAVATFENGGELVQRDEQDIDLAELGN